MAKYRAFLVASAIVVVLSVVMVVTEAATWPGGDSGCVVQRDCYCEMIREDGFASQPINTVSNIGFVAVGLFILWGAAQRVLVNVYGSVAVGLGIGSALFHGTITGWGGWADLVSMYVFISLLIAINLGEVRGWALPPVLGLFAAMASALSAIQVPLEQGNGKFIFGGLVGVALLTEWAAGPRDRRWLAAALGVFAASFVAWNLSRTGASWCDPNSALQGHALWHLGSATTVAFLYRYLKPVLVKF